MQVEAAHGQSAAAEYQLRAGGPAAPVNLATLMTELLRNSEF
jgi:hypothetical protein